MKKASGLLAEMEAASAGGQVAGHATRIPDAWVAVIGKERFAATVKPTAGGFDVVVDNVPYELRTDWSLAPPLFRAQINGVAVIMQVECTGIGYRIIHAGLDADFLVLALRAAEHQTKMRAKKPRATSRHLLSPMPGLVRAVAGAVSQEVKAGDELAVGEAMKMENNITAETTGTVTEVRVAPGDAVGSGDIVTGIR